MVLAHYRFSLPWTSLCKSKSKLYDNMITTNTSFRSFFSDKIGYKPGLTLNAREMIDFLDKHNPSQKLERRML